VLQRLGAAATAELARLNERKRSYSAAGVPCVAALLQTPPLPDQPAHELPQSTDDPSARVAVDSQGTASAVPLKTVPSDASDSLERTDAALCGPLTRRQRLALAYRRAYEAAVRAAAIHAQRYL
jgi:hypothetical protein